VVRVQTETPTAARAGSPDPVVNHALLPYLPRLAVEWLDDHPEVRARTIAGTLVFADISGFTRLTERLARQGQVGAEEMGDTLNAVFGPLLHAAYRYGAGLVKWGGDAVLLLFDGSNHAARAADAAVDMQRVIREVGAIPTSSGRVRLRMSIGLHSGPLHFLLVGQEFRELVMTGPGATAVTGAETSANAGEIVVTAATVPALDQCGGRTQEVRAGVHVLVRAPTTAVTGIAPRRIPRTDLRQALPESLAEHLVQQQGDYEHRNVAVCFVEFSGVDTLLAAEGLAAVADAVDQVVSACQRAALSNGVTFLATDVYPDGGKIILVGGAPTSRGDDVSRVLTAARQVLDSDQRLSLRAGVNVGRVFAGDYGPGNRRVYSITGDCVNLAARLMAKAQPRQLVASAAALDRSRTPFSSVPLEPFLVKGKTQPVQASVVGAARVLSAGGSASRTPFVGRARELDLVRSAWMSAAAGAGQALEVVAEAGMGKSRLLEAAGIGDPGRCFRLVGDIYATSTPYYPFHQLLAQILAIEIGDPRIADRLRTVVDSFAPDLSPMLPLIGIAAGVDLPATPEVDRLDPGVRKGRLEAVVSDLLGRIYAEPLLLQCEDVHFMDEASTDLLDRLVVDAAERPWLLIATRRPDSDWHIPPAPHTASVELQPLDDTASRQLLSATAEELGLSPHRVQALVRQASGNPLFLAELAATADALRDELPASVEAVIAARIDRLPPAARRLLRAASVLGMVVDPDLLRALVPTCSPADLTAVGEFLVADRGDVLRFGHHLVRDSAYHSLPYRRRAELHGAVADLLSADRTRRHDLDNLMALHSLRAHRYADAYRFARTAGDRARERYANVEATECYEHALAAAAQLPEVDRADLARILEDLTWLHSANGDLDAMERCARRARRLSVDDPRAQARLAQLMAARRQLEGRYASAIRWLAQGRRSLAGLGDRESVELMAVMAERRARLALTQHRLRTAIRWAGCAIEEARSVEAFPVVARAIGVRDLARCSAGEHIDLAEAARTLAPLDEERDLEPIALCSSSYGVIAYEQGDWTTAAAYYAAAGMAYRRLGRLLDIALMGANEAEILVSQGELDRAEQLLTEAVAIWRTSHSRGEQGFGTTQLGRVALSRGDFETAHGLFEDARALHEEADETFDVIDVDCWLAECEARSGDLGVAMARIKRVIEREAKLGPLLKRARRVEGIARLEIGETDAGAAALRWSAQLAREAEMPHDVALALLELERYGVARASELEELRTLRVRLAVRLGVELASPSDGP